MIISLDFIGRGKEGCMQLKEQLITYCFLFKHNMKRLHSAGLVVMFNDHVFVKGYSTGKIK